MVNAREIVENKGFESENTRIIRIFGCFIGKKCVPPKKELRFLPPNHVERFIGVRPLQTFQHLPGPKKFMYGFGDVTDNLQ